MTNMNADALLAYHMGLLAVIALAGVWFLRKE